MAEPEAAPARLPRGRHGLSRDEVTAAQRARMMLALAEVMGEKGYVATTVADVLRRAGVSRETFYQQFSSKLDCFLATFDAAGEVLLTGVEELAGADGPPIERMDRLLTRYVDTVAANAGAARVLLVEVHAAGPEAMARRAALQRRIVDLLVEVLGATGPDDRFACEVLVAAVGAMVTGPLVAGDLDALRALRPPLLRLVERALAR